MTNPVAFNPMTMTANELKDCADTLRTVFDLIENGGTDEDVRIYVEMSRENMAQKWNRK